MKYQRLSDGAERRVLLVFNTILYKPFLIGYRYLPNMNPLCGLAIVSTASRIRAPVLRDFLQRYITYRVFFGISMV